GGRSREETLRAASSSRCEIVSAILGTTVSDGTVTVAECKPCKSISTIDEFELDVDALATIRLTPGLRLLGIVHSHPEGAAEPSAADYVAMLRAPLLWGIVGQRGGEATIRWFIANLRGLVELPEHRQ